MDVRTRGNVTPGPTLDRSMRALRNTQLFFQAAAVMVCQLTEEDRRHLLDGTLNVDGIILLEMQGFRDAR